MAFSKLEKAMATFIGLDILRPGTSRKAAKIALGALIKSSQVAAPYAGRAAVAGVPAIGRAAAYSPVGTGAALGYGFLQTPPGEELLSMAEERGRYDRDRFNFALDWIGEASTSPTIRGQVREKAKRKVSKYNRAVSVGMKALKASKFDGVKGSLRNPQASFKKVNKTVSKMNKGQKVSSKGAIGAIKRGAGKVLGAIKKTKPRRGFLEKRYGNPFDK